MTIKQYKWSNDDKAYEEYGNYITQNQKYNSNIKNNQIEEADKEMSLFSARTGLLVESDVHEEDSNHKESSNYQEASININKQRFIHDSDSSSNLTATIKHNIPKTPFQVNNHPFAWILVDKIFGNITITANAAAARLVNNPEKTLAQDLEKNLNTKSSLTKSKSPSQQIYYPFRSLFTGRKQEELEFEAEDKKAFYVFKAQIPKSMAGGELIIPSLKKEKISEYDTTDFSNIERIND